MALIIDELVALDAEEALQALFQARATSLEHQVERISRSANTLGSAAVLGAFRPVNPLLVATALATSIELEYDLDGILGRYASGEELPDLEQLFLSFYESPRRGLLEPRSGPIMYIEQKLIDVLDACAMDDLNTNGPRLPEHFVNDGTPEGAATAEVVASIPASMIPGSTPQVIWSAWLLANPIVAQNPFAEDCPDWALRFRSHQINDHVLENVEMSKKVQTQIGNDLNARLADQDTSEDAIVEISGTFEYARSVTERAERFYLWSPDEAVARQRALMFYVESLRGQGLMGQNDLDGFGKAFTHKLSQAEGSDRWAFFTAGQFVHEMAHAETANKMRELAKALGLAEQPAEVTTTELP